MKHIYWLFLLPLLYLSSCIFPNKVELSKEITEYNIPINGVTSLDASGIYHIEIIKGTKEGLKIKCNSNLKEYLDIEQKGEKIQLDMDNISTDSDLVLEATLTVMDLDRIDLSGAVSTKMNDANFDKLELNLSGASGLKADNYSGNDLNVSASGAARLKMDGKINSLKADFSGASSIKGKNLTVKEMAAINGSGACQFTISCKGKLIADLSGASNLTCYGNPKNVSEKTSGASNVKLK